MKQKNDKFDKLMQGSNLDKANSLLQEMQEMSEKTFREATEFKPGELTVEEEIFVKQNNLNALNYIPLKTLKEQEQNRLAYADNMKRRSEILARPVIDPERINLVNKDRVGKINRGITSRLDGFGYGTFLFLIAAFAWLIKESHGWPIGIFSQYLCLQFLKWRIASTTETRTI